MCSRSRRLGGAHGRASEIPTKRDFSMSLEALNSSRLCVNRKSECVRA